VTRRLIAVVLAAFFVAGPVFAQEQADSQKEAKQMKKDNPLVEIETNHGNIYLEVFQNETPIHAGNFLAKVDAGKYNGLTFHRIVPNFVIQGGDPSGNGTGRMEGPALADEKSPFPEVRGTVAMARSDSASNCQFYINLKDNTRLDQMKFSAFAKVVKGMDVVDEIATVKRDQNDKPLQPVVMTKVHRVDQLPSDKAKAAPAEKQTTEMKKAAETEKTTEMKKAAEPEQKPAEMENKTAEPEKKATEPDQGQSETTK
jgi:peptidyl-prolyl cis-trans isomerase B (cyclophilin B)